MFLNPKTRREAACLGNPNEGEFQETPQGGFYHAFCNAQVTGQAYYK